MHQKPIDAKLRNVSRRIAEIRASKGLTQSQMAEMIDRSLDMIQVWERGKGITLRTLFLIAMVLDTPIFEFFKAPKTPKPGAGRPHKPRR